MYSSGLKPINLITQTVCGLFHKALTDQQLNVKGSSRMHCGLLHFFSFICIVYSVDLTSHWDSLISWVVQCLYHKKRDTVQPIQTISRIPFLCGRCLRNPPHSYLFSSESVPGLLPPPVLRPCVMIPVCKSAAVRSSGGNAQRPENMPSQREIEREEQDRKFRCFHNSLIEALGIWHVAFHSPLSPSHSDPHRRPLSPKCIRLGRSSLRAHFGPPCSEESLLACYSMFVWWEHSNWMSRLVVCKQIFFPPDKYLDVLHKLFFFLHSFFPFIFFS